MKYTTIDLSPPAAQTTFGSVASVGEFFERWVQVQNTSGSETVQISGSLDGTNYSVLTGSAAAGQLPANGSIASDGIYQIPHAVQLLKAQKTAGGTSVVVKVTVGGRKAESAILRTLE